MPTCTHPPRFQEGLRAQPAPTPQRPGWHHLLGGPQAAGRAVMSPCGGNHGNSSGSHSVRRGGTNPGCEGQRGAPHLGVPACQQSGMQETPWLPTAHPRASPAPHTAHIPLQVFPAPVSAGISPESHGAGCLLHARLRDCTDT